MRKLKFLFTVQEGEKVTEKTLRRVLISSVCSILLCMMCLFSTTWAWFAVSVESDFTISIVSQEVQAEIQPKQAGKTDRVILMTTSDGDAQAVSAVSEDDAQAASVVSENSTQAVNAASESGTQASDASDGDAKSGKGVSDGDEGTVESKLHGEEGKEYVLSGPGTYEISMTLCSDASEDDFQSVHTSYVVMEAVGTDVDGNRMSHTYYVELADGGAYTYFVEVDEGMIDVRVRFTVSWTIPEGALELTALE